MQLDYEQDDKILQETVLNNNDRIKTILILDKNSLNILNKPINNNEIKNTKESQQFTNKMEFADLLVKFRDKLHNLYKSKNKDNIKNICEQYIDTLNVLHKIIQQNKIYNNYEINLGCSVDDFFYMSKNDFNDIQYDDENKKTQYYQIPRKLLRIQNARCVLQNYTKYDPNNINNKHDINWNWNKYYDTEETDLGDLPDHIHSNYTELLNLMMKCHYLIIRSINEILYLYFKDVPIRIRSDGNVNSATLHEQYIKFFNTMKRKTRYVDMIRSEQSRQPAPSFLHEQYNEIYNFYDNTNQLTTYRDYLSNKYLDDITSLCYLYDLDSTLQEKIQRLKECYTINHLSFIGDNKYNISYVPRLQAILKHMSKKLS